MTDIQNARLATLVTLAERRQKLGRTALMKLCYFLQVLRNVPLGYRFTLYSYGPFDSSVLSDLDTAEAIGGLHSEIVYYPNGYGYEIAPSEKSESVKAPGTEFVTQYQADINWVIQQFAGFGSADLELLSTIVYVDRELAASNTTPTSEMLIQTVREIKPHFTDQTIRERLANLRDQGLLKSVHSDTVTTN